MAWKGGKLTSVTLQSPDARSVVIRYGEKKQTVDLPARRPAMMTADQLN
jgi:hypothetical protein